ncbi:MAG: hypothetical protein AAF533_29770 [Acidobacteriota bacterium]
MLRRLACCSLLGLFLLLGCDDVNPTVVLPEDLPDVDILTAEQCLGLGAEIVSDPGDGSVTDAGCPAGRHLHGYVAWIELAPCCSLPPQLTVDECVGTGGEVLLVPGAGSCPDRRPILGIIDGPGDAACCGT